MARVNPIIESKNGRYNAKWIAIASDDITCISIPKKVKKITTVTPEDGSNSHVILQGSPDGIMWCDLWSNSLNDPGVTTTIVSKGYFGHYPFHRLITTSVSTPVTMSISYSIK